MEYDHNIWFNPKFAIHVLWRLRERFGQVVINSNRFQKEREAWAVATALLGIMKLSDYTAQWWLQIPEQDPPDIYAMTLTTMDENHSNMNLRLVEVMEVTTYTNSDLISEILTKLKNKSYQKETCLLVHLRRDIDIDDMRELSENLKKEIIGVSDVWVLGSISLETNDFILFSLYPDVNLIRFNIDEELPKQPPVNTLQVERGKGTGHEVIKSDMPKFNPQHREVMIKK